jgi:hypothetical protein
MPDSPLNPEHCDCLDKVLQSIARTRELIHQCKDCGLDMSRAEEENIAQEALATRLKAKFFPNRP